MHVEGRIDSFFPVPMQQKGFNPEMLHTNPKRLTNFYAGF